MQADFGNCSSSPREGWRLPNPALHVAAIPQPSASLGATSQLWTQPKGIASHPEALYSLLGKQIEGEDATWLFLRNINSLVRKELKSNTPSASVPAQGSSGQGAMSHSRS